MTRARKLALTAVSVAALVGLGAAPASAARPPVIEGHQLCHGMCADGAIGGLLGGGGGRHTGPQLGFWLGGGGGTPTR